MTATTVVPVIVQTDNTKFLVYVDYHQDMVYFMSHYEYETDELKRQILATLDNNMDLTMPEISKGILEEIAQLRVSTLEDFAEMRNHERS